MVDKVYGVHEFAKEVGISLPTLRNWLRKGEIVSTKMECCGAYQIDAGQLEIARQLKRGKGRPVGSKGKGKRAVAEVVEVPTGLIEDLRQWLT